MEAQIELILLTLPNGHHVVVAEGQYQLAIHNPSVIKVVSAQFKRAGFFEITGDPLPKGEVFAIRRVGAEFGWQS